MVMDSVYKLLSFKFSTKRHIPNVYPAWKPYKLMFPENPIFLIIIIHSFTSISFCIFSRFRHQNWTDSVKLTKRDICIDISFEHRAWNSRRPRVHWPPDFPNGPWFLRSGPEGHQFVPTCYICIHVWATGFRFGPSGFFRRAPRKKNRVSSSVSI